jgi:hypothetical protein
MFKKLHISVVCKVHSSKNKTIYNRVEPFNDSQTKTNQALALQHCFCNPIRPFLLKMVSFDIFSEASVVYWQLLVLCINLKVAGFLLKNVWIRTERDATSPMHYANRLSDLAIAFST